MTEKNNVIWLHKTTGEADNTIVNNLTEKCIRQTICNHH